MSLYNQIKKYTEQGKLVVTQDAKQEYIIYGDRRYGRSNSIKQAYIDLDIDYWDETCNYDGLTLLGFYNPDTGEVEAIEEGKVNKSDEMEAKKPDIIEIIKDNKVIFKIDNEGKASTESEEETLKYFAELISKANKTKKGFDPETLTFDGVEIKEGDKVDIRGLVHSRFTVSKQNEKLVIAFGSKVLINLFCLNITAHYPQKSELEKLEEDLEKAINNLNKDSEIAFCVGSGVDSRLDRYYQARKALENFKSNNQ